MPTSPRKRRTSAKPVNTKKITNYQSALKWVTDQTNVEKQRVVRYNEETFNLDRMKKLLKNLGNPQNNYKCVHVAGTKGKGSTCAMLSAMLQKCDYTVGLYTSPHLLDIRERIQINGEMIIQGDFTALLKKVQVACNKMPAAQYPSFFEIMTAASLVYFAEQAIDIAIMETGLGGRLDATNVLSPEVSAITEISYDHMDVLGKELTSIAGEKAGIMKKGVPVVTVEQEPEVEKVFRDKAEEVGTDIKFVGQEIDFSYRFEATRELGHHFRICIQTDTCQFEHLAVPMYGEHQTANCALALAVIDALQQRGFEIPEQAMIDGLAETQIPGRMEMILDEPRIMIDGAHNAASIRALVKAIGAHIPYDSLVMVFGCSTDKDVNAVLKEVNLGADKVIFTRAKSHPKAIEAEQLLSRFNEFSGKMAQVGDDLGTALNLAGRAVGREDLILVCGSFYLAGEAKKYIQNLIAKREKELQNA